ncbi:glycosyltransferase family 2 protein [Terrabacter aerolatus]|uniref:Glycosyl transferase n=1 Tax=Terrabacter aerolatus TaxID=422442 RepID=A0A512D3N5_9MICO|nr:glycosyltransferase family 2 protein [Terrabacter aerolatus]GEO31079.1 glycosyl transferase [Terrabacter aerolatus]
MQGGTHAAVTLIVVTWNSGAHVVDLLSSLDAGLEGTPNWRILVVDNDSRDDTVDLVAAHRPDAKVIGTGCNAGYAAAVNVGVAASEAGSAVVVLNPDVALGQGCVTKLLAALEEPGTGIAVPRQMAPDGALQRSLRHEPTVRRAWGEAVLGGNRAERFPAWCEVVGNRTVYAHDCETTWATGSVMAVSRECLEVVGPWDERFFLYSEETDFCLRSRDAGYAVRYVSDAVCTHRGGESHASPALWSLLVVNRLRLFRARSGPVRGAAFHAALLAGEGARAAVGRQRSRASFRALCTGSRAAGHIIATLQQTQPAATEASGAR